MSEIYVSSACTSSDTSEKEKFYVMGNEKFLFDPIFLFSSNDLEEILITAQRLQASGYRGNIYIFPATGDMQNICKEELKNGLWGSIPIPYKSDDVFTKMNVSTQVQEEEE